MEMKGSCHCGGVSLNAPNAPAWVVQCGCGVCRKLGALWAYYPDNAVAVTGATDTYVCNNEVIAFNRCAVCGCTTHWKTRGKDFGRMAINARLLDGLDFGVTQIRVIDGPTPAVFADTWPPETVD